MKPELLTVSNTTCVLFTPQLETCINFGLQLSRYVYIYSSYGKGYKEILYSFLHGNKENEASLFNTVNVLEIININNNIMFKN